MKDNMSQALYISEAVIPLWQVITVTKTLTGVQKMEYFVIL